MDKQDSFDEFSELGGDETRDVDLGDYAAALRGKTMRVFVNRPGVLEAYNSNSGRTIKSDFDKHGKLTHNESIFEPESSAAEYERYRRVVCVLYDKPLDAVKKLQDAKLLFMFNAGMGAYNTYHSELKNA